MCFNDSTSFKRVVQSPSRHFQSRPIPDRGCKTHLRLQNGKLYYNNFCDLSTVLRPIFRTKLVIYTEQR